MEVRRPRLLGADLAEKARLRPASGTATMNLAPLSTASLILPEGEPEVALRDFVEVYGPEGTLGVFRVGAVRTVYGGSRQVSLEHGACTLADDLTREDAVLSGEPRSVLAALLKYQTRARWTLGDVEASGAVPVTDLSGRSVLEAILTVLEGFEGAALEFDQSASPWRLHLRRQPSAPACECRLNRNLQGVSVSVDDAALCTRVTVEDGDGACRTWDADTIGVWGAAHRAIAVQAGDAQAEAQRYLERHKHPTVCVELDALALASLTGEPLDSFRLGQICRVALPEWGVAMDERIVSMHYADLYGQPGRVRLTLSNRPDDASARLNSLRRTAAANSRGVRQSLKYYHELDDRAVIMAKDIELMGEKIELRATKDELGKYLNEVWIDLDAAKATIDIHAQSIDKVTRDITAAGERIDGLNATLTQYAGIVDSQGALLSGVRVHLDGIVQTITQQAGRFDELGNLIEGAQVKIDGLGKTITQQAGEIDAQGKLISGAMLQIDGLNKTITNVAGDLDEQGKLISGAMLELDGLKGQIALKATATDLSGLKTTVTQRLDAQAGEIELKVDKDGVIAAIRASSEEVQIQAKKINLSGYVTASQLEAEVANINRFFAGTASATRISAGTLAASSGLYVYGTRAVWLAKTVLGADGNPTTLHYLGYS